MDFSERNYELLKLLVTLDVASTQWKKDNDAKKNHLNWDP